MPPSLPPPNVRGKIELCRCRSRNLWGVSTEHHHGGIIVNQCALCPRINSWSTVQGMVKFTINPIWLRIKQMFSQKY